MRTNTNVSPPDRHDWPQVRLDALQQDQLDAVVAIEAMAYPHPWTRGNFADSIAAGYHLRGLFAQDELLGYFVAMQGVDEVHLLNITVAPKYQGQGLAVLMLDALRLWALTCQAQWVWLEVRKSNARAQQVYARYGYSRVGVRKNYYPHTPTQREDAVVMSLKL
jgi:ribosomal-protein-alanine N-acetyltransferase